MKNRNDSKAKILILIPIVVFVITGLCLVLATILDVPANRGAFYSFFAFTGMMGMFLFPLPCLVVSIVGTVLAARAAKEGGVQSRIFLAIGIMEILACGAGVFFAIMMFIAGQGV